MNFCKYRLEEDGYTLANNADADFKYFNLEKRKVQPIERKVLISKEFKFPSNLKKGLDIIKKKIKNGEDIIAHLSKEILNLDYHDDLLNDWGIYHLHLGEKIHSKTNFIERTGPILFARFDDENAYFINIYNHGSWTKQEMIRIIHDNWPESVEKFKIKGVQSLSYKPNDKQYATLRKSHISTMVEVEKNVVYAPIGMGYMTSGHSTEVMILCGRYKKSIRKYESYIKNSINKIAKQIEVNSGYNKNVLKFHLWLENNIVFAYEINSNCKIELGQL